MPDHIIASRPAFRTETPFLRFWRALAARCSAAGSAEPTLGAARRAWAAHVSVEVAA